jgi:hypothetical protein
MKGRNAFFVPKSKSSSVVKKRLLPGNVVYKIKYAPKQIILHHDAHYNKMNSFNEPFEK